MECPEHATVSELLSRLDDGASEVVWVELTAHARAVVRSGPDDDAIVSETVLRAMKADAAALRRARPGTPIRAWAAKTARHIRRERARRALPLRVDSDFDAEASSRAAAGRANSKHGWSEIDLAALTDSQNAAWRLRLAGRTEREIASELGISRAAVRERLRRGLKRLKGKDSATNTKRSWAKKLLAAQHFPPSRFDRTKMREMLRDYAAGLPWKTLARIHAASPETLKKRFRRWRAWTRGADSK